MGMIGSKCRPSQFSAQACSNDTVLNLVRFQCPFPTPSSSSSTGFFPISTLNGAPIPISHLTAMQLNVTPSYGWSYICRPPNVKAYSTIHPLCAGHTSTRRVAHSSCRSDAMPPLLSNPPLIHAFRPEGDKQGLDCFDLLLRCA